MKKTFIAILFLIIIVNPVAQGLTKKSLRNSISPDSELISGTDTLKNNSSVLIESFDLELVSPSSGVQFYRDGIVFLSYSKRNEKMLERHLSFGIIKSYYASLNDSVLENRELFSPIDPFPFPSEGLTFNNDFSIVYYSKLSKEDAMVKIYRATSSPDQDNPGWTMETSPLAFCNNSNYSHPTLSSDGTIMIFSSDMPGSIGGMDLFITRYENGKWTTPYNPGSSINSNGNELFAFLDSEKNLFFSSNGLPGLGGYDIFVCKFNGTRWGNPVNLTNIINTNKDEVAFTVNRDKEKSGFFTTRERSEIKGMQLFRINLNKRYYRDNSTTLPVALINIATTNTNMNVQKRIKPEPVETVDPEKERLETERLKAEGLEKERLEARLKAVKLEEERLEAERIEAEKQKAMDVVIYRVQILSSTKSKGQYNIPIDGKNYKTYEYLYKGAWRITIGEFTNKKEAIELQRKCRGSDFKQAFVVAFKNNVRHLDM